MSELTPLRVLIVKDSEDDAALVLHELARGGYSVAHRRVETQPELIDALGAAAWDIVISDHSLHQLSDTQALRLVRAHDSDVPFIIVSGKIDEDAAVAAMRAGANDYFWQDKLARLLPAIQRALAEADVRRERRRMEQELRQAEQRFATVFHASPVAKALARLEDGRMLDVNDRFLAMFGYERDEVIGRTAAELNFIPQGDPDHALAHLLQTGHIVHQVEVSLRARNGNPIVGLISAERIVVDDTVCVLGMIHDITQRKQTEERLIASEQRFRSMIENSYDGIALLDARSRIQYLSPSTHSILGYEDSELLSQITLNLVHPDDVKRIHDSFLALADRPGESDLFTYRLRHKDGSYRWIESIATNLLNEPAVGAIVANYRDITERKRIEDAIRESEWFAHATVDALSTRIVIIDQNGDIIAVNRAWRAFAASYDTGYDHAAGFIGTNYLEYIELIAGQASESAQALIAGIRQMLDSEQESFTHEYQLDLPSEVCWFLCRVTRFQGGGPTRIVVAHENITEQKQAEHELAALYNATSVLFKAESIDDLGNQVVAVIVKELGKVNCGLLLKDLGKGIARSVALAGHHRLTVGDYVRLEGPGLIARALRTGEMVYAPDVSVEPDYYGADPETRSELVIPLTGARGVLGALDMQSTRLAAFSERDQRILAAFAERVAATLETMQLHEEINHYAGELEWSVAKRTAELFQAKEHVEAILNNSSDAIVLTNLKGEIERTNPAFRRLFGYAPDAEIRLSLPAHFEPETLERLDAVLREVATTYTPSRIELACRRIDDTTFDADAAIAPVMEYDSRHFSVIYSLRDITVRKQSEENLRRALAKERELNELKSRFTSMVSHEFRNPLAVIQSSADLIKHYGERMTSERKSEQIDEIAVQVRRLTGLLDDILAVTRAESTGVQVQPQPLDLETFFNDIAREMRLTTRHEIVLCLEGQPMQAVLDPKLLRQAVTNLVSNAIKYSPNGSSVRIDVQRDSEQIVIRISDQGIGIPAEDQKHLFEVFHRASNVGSISGTGLGLAIVKQSVEAHGGRVTVESEVGHGSVFTLVLPPEVAPNVRPEAIS